MSSQISSHSSVRSTEVLLPLHNRSVELQKDDIVSSVRPCELCVANG